ncbi:glycosyltransferase family 4 protein [Candidatus Bipolaricaulota bacterium]|nr:glycosyltransferase family 4 protein [Candidatus Bipolaricaulota bacterium]
MNERAKAKVCIVTTVHPPFDTRIFHKQAKTLAQAGYDVTLIAQHDKNEVVDGVKIIALPRPRNRFARIFGLTWRVFRMALRQKAEVYHFHDPELLPWGALLKLATKAKVIYDVHENVRKQILNKTWLSPWIRKPLSSAYVLMERACPLFLDAIIIAEDSYIENYRGRKNIVAIRNYPNLSYLEPHADSTAERAKEADRSFKVTYVGGVTRLRGALELIEALKIAKADGHQEVMLNLIGSVMPADLKGELDDLIRQYGLEGNISIPGPVPHENVFKILAQSHIGMAVLHPDPNFVESLPTKLFEYMAAGLPVIASNFPLWKEIVEGNECGLTVDPLNPKEIAEAIEYLLDHPEVRQKMGENGRRAAMEKYNWDSEAKKLLALYAGLIG